MNENDLNNFGGNPGTQPSSEPAQFQDASGSQTSYGAPTSDPGFTTPQTQGESWQQTPSFNGAAPAAQQYTAPQDGSQYATPQQPASQYTSPQPAPQYTAPQADSQYTSPEAGYAGQPPMAGMQPGAYTVAVPFDQPYYGCPPVEAISRFFRKYVTFSGRASRSEFWWMQLFLFLAEIVASILDSVIFGGMNRSSGSGPQVFEAIFGLAVFVPQIALMVRRLHDSNKSGAWFVLPYGLLFGGLIIFIVFLAGGAILDGDLDGRGITGGAVIGAIVMLLCLLGSIVSYFIFTLAGPNPAGARFDKPNPTSVPQMTPTEYANPQQNASFGAEQNMAQPMPAYPPQPMTTHPSRNQDEQGFTGAPAPTSTPEQAGQPSAYTVPQPPYPGQTTPEQGQQPYGNNGFGGNDQYPTAQ
ncbi:Uncharacterized membrane protein YhaH, DUF805 family [Bifidobacterium bohemicum]|uniref:DUF805 domain-containing protein n=1 Tax=Bifidobacterium bohemicum DSM 22767 TaxID=1437606 RepID=A0A086ZF15_9BIFI|nr:DUF805 domain-containing protein [Bifidobacterium bohemicum]KFI45115.1 hypothetical protein BBOH_1377 [Bifidobacterium bohemicum DSM 22767]SCB91173.1 Uncharacterized membrane protein YhaH, DUF805 family [Bifidobacterium bohemicum]